MKSSKLCKAVFFTGIINWGIVVIAFLYSSILNSIIDPIMEKFSFMDEFFFAVYIAFILVMFLTVVFSVCSIVYLLVSFFKNNQIGKGEITKGLAIHLPYLVVYALLINAAVNVWQ